MKTWFKFIPLCLGLWCGAGVAARGAPAGGPEMDASVQAIQQANDPSAVVAAFANGMAVDRHHPKLFAAYVARMADLGLPELAYHQARALTTLQSDHGLAWGVVAYAEARRGNMADAIAAIILAGQFAPDHKLVERTADELIAWYDMKADKTKVSENAREGLARVRQQLARHPAFATAYDTARKAYQEQAAAPAAPAGQLPPAQSEVSTNQAAPYGESSAAPAPPEGDRYAYGYTYPNYAYPDYYYA